MRRYLLMPILVVVLIAAACSSDGEDSSPVTPPDTTVETPAPSPPDTVEELTENQQESIMRELLFEGYVQDGLSEESARCVADGLSDEVLQMMVLEDEEPEEEAVVEMMGDLMALQNRCLTPEEIELMGGFGG